MTESPDSHAARLIDEAIRFLEPRSDSPNTQLAIVHLQIAKNKISQQTEVESWGFSNNAE